MVRATIFMTAFAALLLAGCAAETTETPKVAAKPSMDLKQSVTRLHELCATIKEAFDSGDPHSCDGALHEASDILATLPNAATSEGILAEEDVATVKSASKNLFDQLMKIHHGFHDESSTSEATGTNVYDSVATEIAAALSELSGTTTK